MTYHDGLVLVRVGTFRDNVTIVGILGAASRNTLLQAATLIRALQERAQA